MGNKCGGGAKRARLRRKEKEDACHPALQLIREAQRKYFHSHIESDLDDSDEDESREDSMDIYDSQFSLDNLEDDCFQTTVDSGNEADNVDCPLVAESAVMLHGTPPHLADGSPLKPSSNESSQTDIAPLADKENTILTQASLDVQEGSVVPPSKQGSRPFVKKEETSDNHQHIPPVVKHVVVRRPEKAKYIRLSKRGKFFSIFNAEDKKARNVDPQMYQYPFENLVFEGGGNKGLAYCGAIRLLEELNIWPQIKRLAGTSAGAMTAALLAVGYNSHDLEHFFSLNLNDIFLDHRFGYLSLVPNLLSSYGWNPGKRIYKWFGQKMADKTGDQDITFKQVYQMYHRELCIVATNLNQMTSLYCHPKTTPDMPVRLAVRMSMSIPGMFKAVKHSMHGQTDVYVDGGVLCNYPIHCFDGWWLSMEPGDNFLEKLQPLEDIPRLLERTERFGAYNEKTLGFQLYSDNEQDLLKYQLENLRHGVQLQELPNTKLAREKIKKKKLQLKTDREHRRLVKAMNDFLRALRKHNADKNDTIDREELEAALNDQELFPRSRRLILFGDVGSDIILQYLDRDQNGQICFNELLNFMEETGISMQNRFLGYQRRNIKNLPSFLDTLQATLLTNVKRVYVEERDLKRTVGINTGHVGTSDFVLEPADIEFVLERGRRSLEAFLKYYVASNHLKKKPEFKRLKDELRKDSKASLMSTESNLSGGFSVDDTQQLQPGAASPRLVPFARYSSRDNMEVGVTGRPRVKRSTSPLVTRSYPDSSNSRGLELPPPLVHSQLNPSEINKDTNSTVPSRSGLADEEMNGRIRSASSGKSVKISDRVDVIGEDEKDRHHTISVQKEIDLEDGVYDEVYIGENSDDGGGEEELNYSENSHLLNGAEPDGLTGSPQTVRINGHAEGGRAKTASDGNEVAESTAASNAHPDTNRRPFSDGQLTFKTKAVIHDSKDKESPKTPLLAEKSFDIEDENILKCSRH